MRNFAGILLALLAGMASATYGQEWPRFRGPNGTGVSTAAGIPVAWQEQDYLWKTRLPGEGHSSPVVWDDRIFTTCADPVTGDRKLLAVDAPSGEILWEEDFGGEVYPVHHLNTFASGSPAVDAERVYIAFATPERLFLAALSQEGEEVWTQDLGPYASQHGFGSSPIVYKDMVILANDQLEVEGLQNQSFLVALDAATGELRWKSPRASVTAAYSTPFVITASDGAPQLVFSSQAEGLVGVDPASGAKLWGLAVWDKRAVSSPFAAAGLVFGACGSGGGGNYIAAVAPPSPSSSLPPQVAYEMRNSAPYVPTGVAVDGRVYLVSDKGVATCIRAADGSQVWRTRLSNGEYYASPIVVQDRVYAISTEGVVTVFAAEDEYRLLGESTLGEECRSTPAVSGGRLILRTRTQLMAVGSGS
ncbi:MAG: PQQ-binding-like beta-propeller repeat protein [Planctomycetales bacterium]|nr:PQQ-binding-like beta-propeller repeat protein [Planctomycetales bacterium]